VSQTPQPVAQPAPQPDSQTRFLDTQNHWAASCITAMDSWGLMQGYPNGSFQPGGTMTRAEFAAMIVKAYPAASIRSAPNFTDVPAGFWAKRVIQQAYERGFLVGYPNRQFRPNQTISRAQALTILAKAQQLSVPSDTDTTNDILTRTFDDQAAIPDYARGALAATAKANLLVNYPNVRELRPQAAIARGEVAALLCQARSASLPPEYQVPPQYVVRFNPEDNNLWQQATLIKTFDTRNQVMSPLSNTAIFQSKLFFFDEKRGFKNGLENPSLELWTTDGSIAGTQLIKEQILSTEVERQTSISPPSTIISNFMGTSAQQIWFVTEESQPSYSRHTVWHSDGTAAGTSAITPSLNSDLTQAFEQPHQLEAQPNLFLNESFVFPLLTRSESWLWQTQLWQSDGQSSARRLGLFPFSTQLGQPGLLTGSLISTGKQLFFSVRDNQNNTQLWRSDDTGAIALQTLNPVGTPFTPWQNRVYIQAETPQAGFELWASDGTPSGTALLKDIYPGTESSAPRLLTGLGSTFFALANSPEGLELWSTQGTPASTSLVKRLSPFASSRAERVSFVHQGRLFFSFPSHVGVSMSEPQVETGYELWVTDGTASGTQPLAKFPTGNVENFTVFKDRLFFSGGGSGGQELWSTDGTAAGTRQVVDLAPGQTILPAPCAPPNQRSGPCPPATVQEHSSFPKDLTPHGNWLYFLTNGGSLYRTNGTAQGIERIKQFENSEGWQSNPNRIFKVNQRLVIITKVPSEIITEGLTIRDRFQIWSLEL
jgi:ELWxxDGT repeat protein